jgi:predicted ATPase/DNA-binding winged helix-turn-helix (wHTH) protein
MNPREQYPSNTPSAHSPASASRHGPVLYVSGAWEIDCARRELRSQGTAIPIGSRAFEIVEALVQSPGEVIGKDDLMARVWPNVTVEDNTLQVHISAIRKALGADRGLLKTVAGRGYRLQGSWTARQENLPARANVLQRASVFPQPFRTNIPAAASALIGRDGALQELQDLLSAYRAVTLAGPGGIGKTVLASEVARRLFPTIQSDVIYVGLVSLLDAGLVPSAVASTLGQQLGGDQISAEAVARAIGGKRILIVLDNCEHVIDAAATLTETLLRLCPHTTILATSREVLRIDGEHVYHVPPLDVPAEPRDKSADILELSGVRLFVARTKSLRSDFAPQAENIPDISAICRRLDGIPLAIEFAAARAASLGVRQVAERLDDRFALLTGGRRTALPRHQTLRAALDWSYELLPELERQFLRHLAIFPAGFTLEAAAAVMSDRVSEVAIGISNLISKSLVSIDGSGSAGRWRLLETIRAYALQKLSDDGEHERAARRHAEFFRDAFAPANAESSPRPDEDMSRGTREIDNVRAALDWSFSPVGDTAIGVTLTSAYVPVWLHLGLLFECRERAERALDGHGPEVNLSARLRIQLHVALGLAGIFTMGPVERTRAVLATALELAQSLDDIDAQMWAIWGQWVTHYYSGENRIALSLAKRLADLLARIDDPFGLLMADRIVANTLQYGGDQREARRLLEHVIENCTEPRDRRNTFFLQLDQRVLARAMLARALLLLGYPDRAIREARASLEEAQVSGYQFSVCEALRMAVCTITILTGDFEAAEPAVAMLVDTATSANGPFWTLTGRCLEGKLLIKQGRFEAGVTLLRSQLDTAEKTGWAIWYPEFLGVLAEGLAGLGRAPEAIETVDRAIAKAERDGERCYLAELFRIKGGFLLEDGGDHSVAAAEHCFGRALDIAREQGALFWELRAAMDLAQLRVTQDRPHDARQILAPVYDRFTEGFETADFRAARAMLDALPLGA